MIPCSLSFNCACFKAPAGSRRGCRQTCSALCSGFVLCSWFGLKRWCFALDQPCKQEQEKICLRRPRRFPASSRFLPGLMGWVRIPVASLGREQLQNPLRLLSACLKTPFRSGSRRSQHCAYADSIRSPPLSEPGVVFPPPLPSGWEKANIIKVPQEVC